MISNQYFFKNLAFIFHFPSGTDFQLIYRGGGQCSFKTRLTDSNLQQAWIHGGGGLGGGTVHPKKMGGGGVQILKI